LASAQDHQAWLLQLMLRLIRLCKMQAHGYRAAMGFCFNGANLIWLTVCCFVWTVISTLTDRFGKFTDKLHYETQQVKLRGSLLGFTVIRLLLIVQGL